MSATLHPLAAEVLAPSRLGISEAEYRTLIEAVADQLELDDDETVDAAVQREADLGEAEWMIGVLGRAGYTVRKVSP